jgi:bacterioferritin
MKNDKPTPQTEFAGKQLIQALNRDLASEYQAIIAYIVYSEVLKRASQATLAQELELHAANEYQHAMRIAKQIESLGGIPCVPLMASKVSRDPLATRSADPDNEVTSVGHYHYPIRRALTLGELDFGETLGTIIAQEHDHEIHLAAAPGMAAPPPKRRQKRSAANANKKLVYD